MTVYVGSSKIKDTGAYGVYFCPGKTNCLTYTPKNINLTLSNGTLTLKAGSKVYVPNGKNADGSLKFDEVVIENDLSYNYSEYTYTGFACYDKESHNLVVDLVTTDSTVSSGNYLYYDTANNVLQQIDSTGAVYDKLSFPIGIISMTAGIGVTSIDQTFDWCGYIGSTAFVLPGVKGLIPNGWNSDGTYKSVEFETDRVSTFTSTITGSSPFVINTDGIVYSAYSNVYDKNTNSNSSGLLCVSGKYTASSGVITSLTPYSVKTTNDLQTINAIYNGSQKVYQYLPTGKTFNPSGNFQTYVVPKGVNKLQVDCVAAKGNGNGYGGRVQCVLSVTPGQTLYLAVGSANTSAATPTYNASDIRTNGNGITDTTSLQSRLVVAGGGGNTGNQAGTGGHGGGLTGAAGSDVDGKSGQGGSQSAGGAGGGNGMWGEGGAAGGFGLGGRGGNGVGGAGGAGWYGGGGAGASAYGSTLGGNGGGGSSYTNPNLCTSVSHTQGYRNGNGYITLTPIR